MNSVPLGIAILCYLWTGYDAFQMGDPAHAGMWVCYAFANVCIGIHQYG